MNERGSPGTDDLADELADVYGYLAFDLRSRAAAERVAETAFREVGATRPASDPDGRTLRLALLRAAHRAGARDRGGADPADEPALSPRLAAALGRLPALERSVLALRFGARLTASGSAAVLGQPPERVRRLLSRGLRRLRTELDRDHLDE